MADDSDVDSQPGFFKRMSEMPCFRKSFMSGIGSGLGMGLAFFMATSNTRRAANVGVASYFLVTLGTWSVCRYNWSKERFIQRGFKEAVQQKILTEGTELEKKLEQKSEEV